MGYKQLSCPHQAVYRQQNRRNQAGYAHAQNQYQHWLYQLGKVLDVIFGLRFIKPKDIFQHKVGPAGFFPD